MEELEDGRTATGPPADEAAPGTNGPRRAVTRTRDDGPGGARVEERRQAPAAPAPRPRIGDTRPAPAVRPMAGPTPAPPQRRGAEPAGGGDATTMASREPAASGEKGHAEDGNAGSALGGEDAAATAVKRRRRRGGRERRGRSTGRYLICVHVQPGLSQIAVLEGRVLVQHFVSRAQDETTQIDGNIYLGRVQNVLPGMEAAFVDIGIPKNAVLYRGDVRYDADDVDAGARKAEPRIEEVLRPGQLILCQVTKNPIGAKGARLTQEVSLPGRFVVLVPNSEAVGISKRLGDNERRRLRKIVDSVRPAGHGLIVRTAAEGATEAELRRDVEGLLGQWSSIERAAQRMTVPGLLYREPDLAVRILREELNSEYRGVIIDEPALYDEVHSYVEAVSPDLADRVELYDAQSEGQPLFDRYHVHEQLHKALDRKVWLPSGGSLIIERTEALTVIDVNTGKNVGKSNLEETVFRNNLEAAEEVARQLRLRDIGGIIVIDFIDMEQRENREKVAAALRAALARDKTRTQVFDISELGLVEMTRKRISEGLIESLSTECEVCRGRGIVLDASVL
ncbi:MAG: Rne/Rng family ribonuclease [Actinomycetota bacterium]|nr:Rne/Rng family ribonuclease [Actinomycetota bacterium]